MKTLLPIAALALVACTQVETPAPAAPATPAQDPVAATPAVAPAKQASKPAVKPSVKPAAKKAPSQPTQEKSRTEETVIQTETLVS